MTINDSNWQFLHDATGLSLPFNDMYFRYLRDQGYTGTLQDMIAASGLGMNPSGLKNPASQEDTWVPYDLGAQLYDMWDAEREDTFTLSGAAVNGWSSVKNGYSAAQSISASKPIYSATSFNSRPGVTFDGLDDYLTYAGVGVFPTGASAVEMWLLADQLSLAADTVAKVFLSYGGNATTTRRRLSRVVATAVNRAAIGVGDGAVEASRNNTAVDFSGLHVVRGVITATDAIIYVDGQASTSIAVVPATGTTRLRIGSTTSDTPAAFANGVVSFVAFTTPLSAGENTLMLNYLKARGGIA